MYHRIVVLLFFALSLPGASLSLRNQAFAQSTGRPASSETDSQTQPAGTTAQTSPTVLEPVIVTTTRSATSLAEVPAAVSVIDQSDIQLGLPTVGFEEPLNRVPGVFTQNSANFAQDFRLSIRGFGTRTAFGVREVKVLVDGIPETSPDGQTQLDNIDLGAARRIEVLRGPSSSLYGNASGGVINILTEDGPTTPFLETRLMGGSFGLQKYQAKTGGQAGKLNYMLNASYLSLGGFRNHSRAQNVLLTGKLKYTLSPTSHLTTLMSFMDAPFANDPGGITRAQVDADREQARDRNVLLDSGERVTHGRLGFVYRNQFLPGHELTVTQYSVFRQFETKLPIIPRFGSGVVKFDRFGVGGSVKYAHDGRFFGFRNRFMLGVDVELQADNRRRFDNNEGDVGQRRFHQDEDVRSVGPFVHDVFYLRDNLQLSVGLRYDNVRFSVSDQFLGDGDQSGVRTFDHISPMGGILYSPLENLHMYANVSTAFQVPTTTELARPDEGGGFNADLNPQQALNYEIGARGNIWSRFTYNFALFWIVIDDELVAFESESGRNFFRNAGRSERKGAELAFHITLLEGLRWTLAYTFLDAEFDRFITPNGRFDNNDEPGIPPHQLFTELFYAHPSGFYGALSIQHVDDFYVNNANSAENDAYTVLNLRMGYAMTVGNSRIAPFVGIQNIADDGYNGLTRLNALGGRFFEPSAGINAYGGVTVSYDFL